VDKKRDKIERKILDSQERAFWDVHRPVVSAGEATLPVSGAAEKCQPLWSTVVACEQVKGPWARSWGVAAHPPFFAGSIVYIILLLKLQICVHSVWGFQ